MPPRVADVEEYWTTHPPVGPSPRCIAWVQRIRDGWRPNRRITSLGYYTSAEFFGVYIWEYLNVIYPMLDAIREPKRIRSEAVMDLLCARVPVLDALLPLYECKPDGPQCALCVMPPDSY